MRMQVGTIGRVAIAVTALGVTLAVPPVRAVDRDAWVRCASHDGHFARCTIPWRDARLVKRESRAACVRGQGWGVEWGVLWVDRGCRGLFAAGERHGRGRTERFERDWRYRRDGDGYAAGWRPGPRWDREIRLQCDSNKRRYQLCQVDLGRHGRARIARQLSDTRCTEGYSWGWNRAGVWVDHGCRAQFVVDRRW